MTFFCWTMGNTPLHKERRVPPVKDYCLLFSYSSNKQPQTKHSTYYVRFTINA